MVQILQICTDIFQKISENLRNLYTPCAILNLFKVSGGEIRFTNLQ